MNENERLQLDSDLLRTFLAVAGTRNVTRAADVLGRTQSAISVKIGRLEQVLSVKLFHREARGMALTEAGEALVPAAANAVGKIDRIADLFSRPLSGRVRIGIPDDYGSRVLERVLASFAARHPGIEVSVRCGFSPGFPQSVRRGDLDLAVYAAPPEERRDGLLVTERTVWVAHPELVLDPAEPVPLALFDCDCWWRKASIEALERAGRSYRIAYTSESVAGVRAAVGAGLAVGILAESTIEPAMRMLSEKDGFSPLPPSALVLLRGGTAETDPVSAMESAIRAAFKAA